MTLQTPAFKRFFMTQLHVLFVALLSLGLPSTAVLAQPSAQPVAQNDARPPSAEAKAVAKMAQSDLGVHASDLAPNAPQTHVVKKGDTLWGISGLFLTSPWKWPQLWGFNKDVIKDPHWIYPGQTLVLVRDGDRVRLAIADGMAGLPTAKLSPSKTDSAEVKLFPRIRTEALEMEPISTVQLESVAQFLSQPLVLDEPAIAGSGYVLTGPENRVFSGKDDIVNARQLPASDSKKYQLYRPGKPLKDPDTGLVIAYEAFYLGAADLVQAGDVAKLKITTSKEEMSRGDRIMPALTAPSLSFPPHAPSKPFQGRVMTSYNGVNFAGSNMIVTLNKGRKDGLELGHVLAVWRAGETVVDREKIDTSTFWSRLMSRPEVVTLPDQKYGHVIVFRLFENVAYALVLGTTLPVSVGDRVSQP